VRHGPQLRLLPPATNKSNSADAASAGTYALRWLGLLSLLGLAATEYVEAGAIPEEEAEKQAKGLRAGVVIFALMLLWLLTRRR
jgi:hypothetical protein